MAAGLGTSDIAILSVTEVRPLSREREFSIDNLLVRVHCIIEMIKWSVLAPWEFKLSFPGCLLPPTPDCNLPAYFLLQSPHHARCTMGARPVKHHQHPILTLWKSAAHPLGGTPNPQHPHPTPHTPHPTPHTSMQVGGAARREGASHVDIRVTSRVGALTRPPAAVPTLETTQGQTDGFFSQVPCKCYLPEIASVGGLLKICPWVASRVAHLPSKSTFGSRCAWGLSPACRSTPERETSLLTTH